MQTATSWLSVHLPVGAQPFLSAFVFCPLGVALIVYFCLVQNVNGRAAWAA